MSRLNYQIVDLDQHYYEPEDCFTRHIEAKYRNRAVHVARPNESSVGRAYLEDEPISFLASFPSDSFLGPGAKIPYFMRRPADVDETTHRLQDFPEYRDKDARLDLMDRQNTQATVMLPALGICVEKQLRRQAPEMLYPHLRAFNRFLEDDWGYGYKQRIFSVAMLSLFNRDEAVKELDRVIKEGARIIHIHAMPTGTGYAPADPYYDDFWSRVNEAQLLVALHAGDSGIAYEEFGAAWGYRPGQQLFKMVPFQRYACFMERPTMDMIASLVFDNFFGRFPKIKLLSIENGSRWIPFLLQEIEHAHYFSRIKDRCGLLNEDPRDVLRRHLFVTPFVEDDVQQAMNCLGSGQIVLGSDFPHGEGTPKPEDFLDYVDGLSEEEKRLFMRENNARLLGLDVSA